MPGIVESALGNTADEGHLATFKPNTNGTAGPGSLAFAATTAGFAVSAGFALPEPFATVLGAGTRFKVM